MEARLARIEGLLDNLVAGQQRLETGQQRLETGQRELEAGQVRLEARLDRVEVNLEDMRDQIKQVAEGHLVLLSTMTRGLNELEERISRRLEPIEAALRHAR